MRLIFVASRSMIFTSPPMRRRAAARRALKLRMRLPIFTAASNSSSEIKLGARDSRMS